jgi:periplasmic divalent cation tolerance protein
MNGGKREKGRGKRESETPFPSSLFPFPLLVSTTLPSESAAQGIADAAVNARLAACAQVQGPIRSTFRWQGAVDHATEWYCHFKTTRERLAALQALITESHPYDVPEIIATPIVAGSQPYLSWIEESVNRPSR